MDFNTRIFDQLMRGLNDDRIKDQNTLNNSLRLLAKWRHKLIQNTIVERNGTQIMNGPFKGLEYLSGSLEGCYVPKILGSYEQPLHSAISEACSIENDVIINIGSAEGYYAAGFAKLNPNTQVEAFDINTAVDKTIAQLLKKNGIENCRFIGENFTHENFSNYDKKKCLLFIDIEGAEWELLDLSCAPSLKNMTIIVESHDCFRKGTTKLLVDRFSSTHLINIISDNGDRMIENAPEWFSELSHLDQLLAFWEWRVGPTPWIVMSPMEFV